MVTSSYGWERRMFKILSTNLQTQPSRCEPAACCVLKWVLLRHSLHPLGGTHMCEGRDLVWHVEGGVPWGHMGRGTSVWEVGTHVTVKEVPVSLLGGGGVGRIFVQGSKLHRLFQTTE